METTMTELIAIDGNLFTAMERTCMTYIREEFDTTTDFTSLMSLISEAKRLQLSQEFISQLESDLKDK